MAEYCGKGKVIIGGGDGVATEEMSQHVDTCKPCQRALRGEGKGFPEDSKDSDELSLVKKAQAVGLRVKNLIS